MLNVATVVLSNHSKTSVVTDNLVVIIEHFYPYSITAHQSVDMEPGHPEDNSVSYDILHKTFTFKIRVLGIIVELYQELRQLLPFL